MIVRRLAIAVALAGVGPAGCAKRIKPTTEIPAPPKVIRNLDDFEVALNRFVLVDTADPQRAVYRDRLIGFLVGYIDKTLESNEQEAFTALQYAAAILTPAELRTAPPHPALAKRARRLYERAGKRGAEGPALMALAVQQQFGSGELRKTAVRDWQLIEQWLTRNGPYAQDPLLRHEELEGSLEQVAAAFPSAFVTERLADLYVARYQAVVRAGQNRGFDTAARRRAEVTGYLLLRLYLRADDMAGLKVAMGRVALDPPVAKLHEMVTDAIESRRSPMKLLSIADQFLPERGTGDESFATQGWGIVENLARRAVTKYPRHPFAHLLRARTYIQAGLLDAAIHHYRKSITIKEDVFETWDELADLEQRRLERIADRDPEKALQRLPELERFHTRAAQLWRDRPIRPGLPEAYYAVAEGLYQAGSVTKARSLLDKSLELEPVPNTLDLLGTIALKRADFDAAAGHYQELARLVYADELSQLQWEARARQQLAEVARRRGDARNSSKHIRIALRRTNELLRRSKLREPQRADRLVERGKLLFYLGDLPQAMADFREAANLDPDNTKVYADPLLQVVEHGYYGHAVAIFRRALARDTVPEGLKLYFSLWINELALRQGETPPPEAVRYIASFDDGGWGRKLALHARGELGFEQLLQGAGDRGERAEAFFYEGLHRWRSGDPAGAKKLMRKVIETNMMGFFEYDMAQAYLAWNDVPSKARPPLLAGAR